MLLNVAQLNSWNKSRFYLVLNAASHFNTFPRISAISLHRKTYLRMQISYNLINCSLLDKTLGSVKRFGHFCQLLTRITWCLQETCSGEDLMETDAFLSVCLFAAAHLILLEKHLTHIYSIQRSQTAVSDIPVAVKAHFLFLLFS